LTEFNRYAGDTPIRQDEVRPTSTGEAAKSDQLLDPAYLESQRIRFQALMFGQGNRGLSAQQKADSGWQQSFNEFVAEIAGMKPNPGESEAAFYYRKGGSWQTLLIAAPPGPERDKLIVEYIGFLVSSNYQKENPVEWFAPVEGLVSMARGLYTTDRMKLLDALIASGHPVLMLYGSLEKQLAARPDWAK
jgi:hypothetical protein